MGTITNEKGRLSQADIDRMVAEAEKYKSEDEANKSKIDAKNGLENYCYQMKNSMQEMADKFEEDDKKSLETAVDDALKWLEGNQMAEKEEFDAKQKEVEGVANPIMMKVYQAGGAEGGNHMGGMGGATNNPGAGAGPTVE